MDLSWGAGRCSNGGNPTERGRGVVGAAGRALWGFARGRAPRQIGGVMLAPAATESPIAVDRLVKRYKAVTAVDGISFAIEAGSCAALLGGNGAGKTTTISTIMGLVEPTAGTVTVLGAAMPRQRHRVLH